MSELQMYSNGTCIINQFFNFIIKIIPKCICQDMRFFELTHMIFGMVPQNNRTFVFRHIGKRKTGNRITIKIMKREQPVRKIHIFAQGMSPRILHKTCD